MPAILDDADWSTWLGENDAMPDRAKAVLRTVEGVSWKIEQEAKIGKSTRTKSDA